MEGYIIFEEDRTYNHLLVYADKTLALETLMSLVEEDMYMVFCGCLEDELETRTPKEIAQDIKYTDSLWFMQTCTIKGV